MAWPILHNHVSLSASLHSFTFSVSYAYFFFFFCNFGFWKLWFIHSVISLLNLFVIKELSFCMWMFCFMKWAVLLWFPLFILLCLQCETWKTFVCLHSSNALWQNIYIYLPIEWPCNLNPYMVDSTLQLINTQLRTEHANWWNWHNA